MEIQGIVERIKNIDIFLDNQLISKEAIIKKYVDFFTLESLEKNHLFSITLHPGSVLFHVLNFFFAALIAIIWDNASIDLIISLLRVDDMVIYREQKYRWGGLYWDSGKQYMKLVLDGSGKNGPVKYSVPYEDNKHLVKPYYGDSRKTGGTGIIKSKIANKRIDFISYLLNKDITEIAPETSVSTIIVTDRNFFEQIVKRTRIVFEGENANFLDVVTASYYSESGTEYVIGSNPTKAEPILKITDNISIARKLALDKYANKTSGLMIVNKNCGENALSELNDLIERKISNFYHISLPIDADDVERVVEFKKDSSIFACTQLYLSSLNISEPPKYGHLIYLHRKMACIMNNSISETIIDYPCSWEELSEARDKLFRIKESDSRDKRIFFIVAFSLLKLLLTAVFPIRLMEDLLKTGQLNNKVQLPSKQLQKLREIAGLFGEHDSEYAFIVNLLERLYQFCYNSTPKLSVLMKVVQDAGKRRVAIVVPKAFYSDILKQFPIFCADNITFSNANIFDNLLLFDVIISVGDFSGKSFNPLKCKAAPVINVLLYKCETYLYDLKKRRAEIFEDFLNKKMGFETDNCPRVSEEESKLISQDYSLEKLLTEITIVNVLENKRSNTGVGQSSDGDSLVSEVCAIGNFRGGEIIFFSKYYKALVYKPSEGEVNEVDADKLVPGDSIVFLKRDGYTQDMVDYLFDKLKENGKISEEVLNACKKAEYWKKALRNFMRVYEFTPYNMMLRLRRFGIVREEATIRQWLAKESKIVCPQGELTLKKIGEAIFDEDLSNNSNDYHQACRKVRKQRKKILELIGKAITERLKGNYPSDDILKVVFDNMENLSEILELEEIEILEKPHFVSTKNVNKPISNLEELYE